MEQHTPHQPPHTPQPTPAIAQDISNNPVRLANRESDYIVLMVTFLVLLGGTSIYFIASYFLDEVIIEEGYSVIGFLGAQAAGIALFVAILLFGMFMVRFQRQMVLGNALQVEYSDYAWLREWSAQVARDFNMPQIEIYITQDPVINAYALGFIRPYIIVLNSGTIRYLTKDELRMVVVHEMGHIKYWHTNASVYLSPFLALPFIGFVASWISGFWSRRAELTSDRLALMYSRNPSLVKQALVKVHVGPDAAKYLNQVAEQWLHHKADRPMNLFVQTFSSHPFLVRRLGHIDTYAKQIMPPPAPVTPATPQPTVIQ